MASLSAGSAPPSRPAAACRPLAAGWASALASTPSLASSARCSCCATACWPCRCSRHRQGGGHAAAALQNLRVCETMPRTLPTPKPPALRPPRPPARSWRCRTDCWPSCTPPRAPHSPQTIPGAPWWRRWRRRRAPRWWGRPPTCRMRPVTAGRMRWACTAPAATCPTGASRPTATRTKRRRVPLHRQRRRWGLSGKQSSSRAAPQRQRQPPRSCTRQRGGGRCRRSCSRRMCSGARRPTLVPACRCGWPASRVAGSRRGCWSRASASTSASWCSRCVWVARPRTGRGVVPAGSAAT